MHGCTTTLFSIRHAAVCGISVVSNSHMLLKDEQRKLNMQLSGYVPV